ncbi:MAG: hypothetical protein Q9187_003034 [Circinaria calcarea]
MFFDGDLQGGIALALQESKCIVCFVRDTGPQSAIWENEYLRNDEASIPSRALPYITYTFRQIVEQLRMKAVVLRIQEGSQEAEFLAAFCPLSTSPTLVVIKYVLTMPLYGNPLTAAIDPFVSSNGELRGHLRPGLSADQFRKALLEAIQNSRPATISTSEAHTSSTSPIVHPDSPRSNQDTLLPANADVRDMLEERRKRLEADKKKRDAAEKAESIAKAEARRAEAENGVPESPRLTNQVTYAQQQRRRQQETRQERERILKVIENDRMERKYREELRKAQINAATEGNDGADGLVDAQISKEANTPRPSTSRETAVQIRLFDGSTIRSRFPSNQTLRIHVRRWIDEQRPDGDSPYSFRQILAPMPNRPITISEEEESLQSLGLTPSATLVMVPVQSYTAAYIGEAGLLSSSLSAGYNVISQGVGMVSGVLRTFLGVDQDRGSAAQEGRLEPQGVGGTEPANPRGARPGINVRTLRDQPLNRDEQQFYNGNQLNFEPSNDDEKRD